MKKVLSVFIVLLTILAPEYAAAQILIYNVKILDKNKKPLPDKHVWLRESVTGDTLSRQTNSNGVAKFTISSGANWMLNVEELTDIGSVDLPKSGMAEATRTFPYVPEMYKRLSDKPDRSGMVFTTKDQSIYTSMPSYGKAQAGVEIHIKTPKGASVPSFSVNMVDLETKVKYTNKTNAKGFCYFLLPGGKKFYIDLGTTENFEIEKTLVYPRGYEAKLEFVYQPLDVKFETRNDTIIQKIKANQSLVNNRSFVEIMVEKEGGVGSNEIVWLENLTTGKIYEAVSDEKGVARFLIPLDKAYMVHFEFEPDADVLRLDQKYATSNKAKMELIYRPIPRLAYPEQFIPAPDDVFVQTFDNFIKEQWPTPSSEKGVDVFFEWGSSQVNGETKEAALTLKIVSADQYPTQASGTNNTTEPTHICLILDKSGSMESDHRMELLKAAVYTLLGELRSFDYLSIISFDSEANVWLPPTLASNKEEIVNQLKLLMAGGGTSIYEGLERGLSMMKRKIATVPNNRMILITDGYGSKTVDEVLKLTKEITDLDISLATIGVGEYYNYSLLELIAQQSGEHVSQVDTSRKLLAALKKKMTSLSQPMAKDLTIEMIYNDQIVLKNFFGPNLVRLDSKGSIHYKKVYKSMQEMGLAIFQLNKPTREIENQPIILRWNYTNHIGKKVSFEKKAYLTWNEELGQIELIHEAKQKTLFAIAIMNQSIKVMAEAFAREEHKEALNHIEAAMDQIGRLYPDAKEGHVAVLHGELKIYANALRQKLMLEKKKK